jgi:hypothetical protein
VENHEIAPFPKEGVKIRENATHFRPLSLLSNGASRQFRNQEKKELSDRDAGGW